MDSDTPVNGAAIEHSFRLLVWGTLYLVDLPAVVSDVVLASFGNDSVGMKIGFNSCSPHQVLGHHPRQVLLGKDSQNWAVMVGKLEEDKLLEIKCIKSHKSFGRTKTLFI